MRLPLLTATVSALALSLAAPALAGDDAAKASDQNAAIQQTSSDDADAGAAKAHTQVRNYDAGVEPSDGVVPDAAEDRLAAQNDDLNSYTGEADIADSQQASADTSSWSQEHSDSAFRSFDANQDGSLDNEEVAKAHFSALDANGDGRLQENEYSQRVAVLVDTIPDRSWTFADVDRDGNAEVTDVEFLHVFNTASMLPEGLDADGDGLITQAEFTDAARAGRNSMTQQAMSPQDDASADSGMSGSATDDPTGFNLQGGNTNPEGAEQENLTGAESPPQTD